LLSWVREATQAVGRFLTYNNKSMPTHSRLLRKPVVLVRFPRGRFLLLGQFSETPVGSCMYCVSEIINYH
jgi:hypothetical protein